MHMHTSFSTYIIVPILVIIGVVAMWSYKHLPKMPQRPVSGKRNKVKGGKR